MSTNNKTILETEFKLIDNIIHLADIHISKNNNRHKEYREVFDKLYHKISKESENSVIVICGDTVDNKSNLCPEQIILTKELFCNLAEYHDLIIILGNHDLNPNNTSINSISAIIDRIQTKNNIFLLTEPGIYEYNNILFGLTSMECKQVMKCYPEKNKIRVGLYHGIIHGATNDKSIDLSNTGHFNTKAFKKYYDITCLGDVHKFQYLNKEQTIAYASSLIQQNIGEDADYHGYLKWNLDELKPKFVKINNNYKLIRIEINNDTMEACLPDTKITKNALFHVYYSDLTLQEINTICKNLQDEYYGNKYILHCEKMKAGNKIEVGKKIKKNIMNIQSKQEVLEIIMKYVIKHDKYKELKKKHRIIFNKQLDLAVSTAYSEVKMELKRVKLIDLKYSNFFLYGNNNYINYENMDGIIGIVAPSYCGKSTTIDALLYSIFGKCTRGNVADTINVNETTMKTHIRFMLNDDKIEIIRERSGKRKVNTKTRSHMISKEKVTIKINKKVVTEDNIDDSNKFIEKIIGSYDNFVNIIIMTQKHCENFIDLTCAKRKEFICKTLRLDILTGVNLECKRQLTDAKRQNKEGLLELANVQNCDNELHEKKTLLVELNEDLIEKETSSQQLLTAEIEIKIRMESIGYSEDLINKNKTKLHEKRQLEKELEQNEITIANKRTELNVLIGKNNNNITKSQYKEKNEQFQQELKQLTTKLYNTKYDDTDITKINIEYDVFKKEIKKLIQYLQDLKQNKQTLENKITEIDSKILDTLHCNKDKIRDHQTELKNNKKRIKYITKALESLETHEYDINCKFCMQNTTTLEKIRLTKDFNELETENKLIDMSLVNLINYETKHSYVIDLKKSNDDIKSKLDDINTEITKYQHQLDITIAKSENLEERINDIKHELDKKRNNYKIEKQIEDLEKEQLKLNNEWDKCIEIKENITENKETINNIQDVITKLNQKIDVINKNIKDGETALEHKEEYEKLSNKLNKIITKKQEFNDSIKQIKTDISKTNDTIIKLKINQGNYDAVSKKVKDSELAIKALNVLTDILSGDKGIINQVLDRDVLPQLTENVNAILTELGDYTVKVVRHGAGIDIIKLKGGKELNIETNSGCEEFISNIGFRMALAEMSSDIKTDMMIIDEAFRFLDDATINKMPSIINYMKNHYQYVIMISHDERIIKLYDKEYTIQRKHGRSYIEIN